jgi:Cu(I)/Ag(I) efflux system membrane protein CusA/SilA
MYLLNYNMSIAVAVGFIALAGVAVEIGVLMLVYLNQSYKSLQKEASNEGRILTKDDIRQAVMQGAGLRVRPIMMTVMATFFGLVPIMVGSGTGSEVMQRIAGPMIGGMISTIVLTLLVLPVIFFVWKQASIKQHKS